MQRFFTVRVGDTITQIARQWNIPVESLIAANNLAAPYTIFIGQQLSMPPGVDVYRVQAGDSVYSIAQRYGVSQQIIITANELRPPYTLQIDQLLTVPSGSNYYVVQPGDSLYEIARRFNVMTAGEPNYEIIRQVNQLPNYTIFIGQQLIIPYAPPGLEGSIAYFSYRNGSYELWLYDLSNGANVQWTKGLGDSFSIPYWSPDNQYIAYLSGCNEQSEGTEMWLLNINHPVPIKLTEGASIVSLNWSPRTFTNRKHTFTSNVYRIQLDYPSNWEQIDETRFEREDGFFQVSAIQSEERLEVVCQNEAFHMLRPYGTEPIIVPTQIQNQAACFIFPSDDQLREMRNQAALIATYPTPVVINGTSYRYFILWADNKHMEQIGNSICFL